jgi:hypothetical protein
MTNRQNSAVVLPAGHTGSSLFHAVLTEAVDTFPDALAGARLPTQAEVFKREYGTSLARFEAARVNAPERVDIARFITGRTQAALRFGDAHASEPLAEYLRERAPTPFLEHARLTGPAKLEVEVPLEGRLYRGRSVHKVIDRLYEAHQLTSQARKALAWIIEHAEAAGGSIDLTGQRFVLFGAGAELSSTRMLLRAGASVLWIDLSDPLPSLGQVNELSGSITQASSAKNLLESPREIAAAVRAFAEQGPVHVGMFAYAPGASKEWRLAAAMNAIVASLEPALVRSISLLISPTTPSVLSAETRRAAEVRYLHSPSWQRILERAGLIQRPGHYRAGDAHVSLSTVSLQGLSYQAAQYISKIAAAESYAVFGISPQQHGSEPVAVSANVAGVTRTRSLSHPLFDAAFLGADKFGVRIFDPATTRALNGLLMLHDLLNPEAPGAPGVLRDQPNEKASAVLSQQVHGGVYSLPFVLEPVIRAAAIAGLASRPSLLVKRSAPAPEATLLADAAE